MPGEEKRDPPKLTKPDYDLKLPTTSGNAAVLAAKKGDKPNPMVMIHPLLQIGHACTISFECYLGLAFFQPY